MECYPCARLLLQNGIWDPQMDVFGDTQMNVFGYPQMYEFGYPQMNVFGYPQINVFGYPQMNVFGYPRINVFGYPQMNVFGIPMDSMDSHGSLWIPMDSYGSRDPVFPRNLLGIHGILSKPCPSRGSGQWDFDPFQIPFWKISAPPMVATVSIRSKTFSSLLFLRFPGSDPASPRGSSENLPLVPRGGPGNLKTTG